MAVIARCGLFGSHSGSVCADVETFFAVAADAALRGIRDWTV
jgi:hypothetical protein